MGGMDDIKTQARNKGLVAVGALVGSGLLFWLWWPLGVVGLGATGYLTYKWIMFRAKWGMRF